jgi:cell division protein FtsL
MIRHAQRRRPVAVVHRPVITRNLVLLVILVTIFAIFHVVERNHIKGMLVNISRSERQLNQLLQQNKMLQVQMYKLEDAERIRRIAKEQLNMVESSEAPKIVFYESNTKKLEEQNEIVNHQTKKDKNLALLNPNILIGSMER